MRRNVFAKLSDGNVKGVPAVVFADAAPILSRRHRCRPVSNLPIWQLPGWSGASLGVILVILVEEAVLHHAEAGGDAQVLAAPLVLLDGLVQRPQLAQQGHVLLTQTHLEETEAAGQNPHLIFKSICGCLLSPNIEHRI